MTFSVRLNLIFCWVEIAVWILAGKEEDTSLLSGEEVEEEDTSLFSGEEVVEESSLFSREEVVENEDTDHQAKESDLWAAMMMIHRRRHHPKAAGHQA